MKTTTKSRRGRARESKRAERLHPSSNVEKPVRPGLEGGAYKPLSDRDIERIHHAALDVLERVGIGEPTPELIELALSKGCTVTESGRLCFPRTLIEDVVAARPKGIVLHGREKKHDLELSASRVHFGTGGAAVKTLDWRTGEYRSSTIKDLYDFARLVDTLDNVHWFTRCCVATDIEDLLAFDLTTAYACVAGTTKHIGTAITLPEHVKPIVQMFDTIAGGEGGFAKRPFCKLHASPMISPLRFGADALGVIAEAVRFGMPINGITAGQSGATAPATLAGALVQTFAETLAAVCYVDFLKPGHPAIFSNWPFVSDLRTGSFSGGGGEEALLNAASAQIANHYGLISGVAASMADAKLPDNQAGFEKAMTIAAAGLSGANLVYESAGMLASLLGVSHESFVIDNEMLGFALRIVRGIEVTDETLSVELIEQTVNGPGHFLGADQTINIMETEYIYPELGDRNTPDEWKEKGSTDMRQRARSKVEAILAEHYPKYIDEKLDDQLRERFPIELARERMAP